MEFHGSINAKKAFTAVAYSRFVDRPLYLEWAPINCLEKESEIKKENFNEPKGMANFKSYIEMNLAVN